MIKYKNRWTHIVVGVVILLFSGMVYAWSVLSVPIAQEFSNWTAAQLSLTFTIAMIMFCIGGLLGGYFSSRLSQKLYIWVSAGFFLIGFLLASVAHAPAMLYVGFGVICGLGSGFSYNAVLSTVGKWFPDKQGLCSGILLMGFGLSSFIIGKVYQLCTPNEIGAWRHSFVVLGIITAVCFIICGFFLEKPDDAFILPKSEKKKHYVNPVAIEANTATMLKKPAFWLFYIWNILTSAAALSMVSQASSIVREVDASLTAGIIATLVGLISIFNGAGRVILGNAYDRSGRSGAMQTVNVLFIISAVLMSLALKWNNVLLVIVAFILGGLAFGGVSCSSSAFVSLYYGMQHYAMNLPVVVTNLLVASFGSTIAGALYDATGSYQSTFWMIGILAFAGIIASLGINLCDKKDLER